jgi:hypothetical protein
MKKQTPRDANTGEPKSSALFRRARRSWRRLVAACAVPTILACAQSPVAPGPDTLDGAETEIPEVVDPLELHGTDRGGEGPPYLRPEGSTRY